MSWAGKEHFVIADKMVASASGAKRPVKNIAARNNVADFLICQTAGGRVKLEVRYEGEILWMTQKSMAKLFDTTTDNISLHLKNIYAEGELDRNATAENFSAVQNERKRTVAKLIAEYLGCAENQAKRHQTITMRQWVEKLDAFLRFIEELTRALKKKGKVRQQ